MPLQCFLVPLPKDSEFKVEQIDIIRLLGRVEIQRVSSDRYYSSIFQAWNFAIYNSAYLAGRRIAIVVVVVIISACRL